MRKLPKSFSIGVLSKHSGCKIPTIRYYEELGLMPKAYRTEGNQRRYNPGHLRRLMFILHARELGFGLEDIRELIDLSESNAEKCFQADTIARKHLTEVEFKIKRLKSLQQELQQMLNSCKSGDQSHCGVIDVLSDHSLCRDEH